MNSPVLRYTESKFVPHSKSKKSHVMNGAKLGVLDGSTGVGIPEGTIEGVPEGVLVGSGVKGAIVGGMVWRHSIVHVRVSCRRPLEYSVQSMIPSGNHSPP